MADYDWLVTWDRQLGAIEPDALAAIGIVELATTAEAMAGTDTTRAVTPAGLKAVADTKADSTHTHDDRYYTEAEVDALLSERGSGWAVSIPPTSTVPQATERPNSSFAPPNGRLYFRPFRALQRTYSQIGILVTTAGTGTVRLAIFARGADGSVGELLLDCGSVSPIATGPIWSMINWTPSQPDVYLAVVCQDPGSLQVSSANSSAPFMSNGVIQASDGGNLGNYFQSGVAGPIPAVPNPGTYATSGAPTIVIA